MVESQFSKLIVAGSSPVPRSDSLVNQFRGVSEWPMELDWKSSVPSRVP